MFSDMHLRTDVDGELVILDREFVIRYGAVCLDGSAPGYYIKKGSICNTVTDRHHLSRLSNNVDFYYSQE